MKHKSCMAQQGSTAVELAIVLPLLVLLIFVIIEFGLYIFNRQVITNTEREGARAGIISRPVRLTNEGITNVVLNYSQQHLVNFGKERLEIDDITIKPIDDDLKDGFNPATHRCVRSGCDLEVQIGFTYDFLFLKTIGINSLNIKSLASMKME